MNGLLNCVFGDDIFHRTFVVISERLQLKIKVYPVRLLPFKKKWMKGYFIDQENRKNQIVFLLNFPTE